MQVIHIRSIAAVSSSRPTTSHTATDHGRGEATHRHFVRTPICASFTIRLYSDASIYASPARDEEDRSLTYLVPSHRAYTMESGRNYRTYIHPRLASIFFAPRMTAYDSPPPTLPSSSYPTENTSHVCFGMACITSPVQTLVGFNV